MAEAGAESGETEERLNKLLTVAITADIVMAQGESMTRTNETATTLAFRHYFQAAQARTEARYADLIVGPVFEHDGWYCFRSWGH